MLVPVVQPQARGASSPRTSSACASCCRSGRLRPPLAPRVPEALRAARPGGAGGRGPPRGGRADRRAASSRCAHLTLAESRAARVAGRLAAAGPAPRRHGGPRAPTSPTCARRRPRCGGSRSTQARLTGADAERGLAARRHASRAAGSTSRSLAAARLERVVFADCDLRETLVRRGGPARRPLRALRPRRRRARPRAGSSASSCAGCRLDGIHSVERPARRRDAVAGHRRQRRAVRGRRRDPRDRGLNGGRPRWAARAHGPHPPARAARSRSSPLPPPPPRTWSARPPTRSPPTPSTSTPPPSARSPTRRPTRCGARIEERGAGPLYVAVLPEAAKREGGGSAQGVAQAIAQRLGGPAPTRSWPGGRSRPAAPTCAAPAPRRRRRWRSTASEGVAAVLLDFVDRVGELRAGGTPETGRRLGRRRRERDRRRAAAAAARARRGRAPALAAGAGARPRRPSWPSCARTSATTSSRSATTSARSTSTSRCRASTRRPRPTTTAAVDGLRPRRHARGAGAQRPRTSSPSAPRSRRAATR